MCFSSNINCSIVSIHASVYSFPCVGLKHRNILVKHNMDTNWNYNYHNLFVIPSSCKACWKMQICVCASGTHTRKCAACCLYVWEVIPCKRMLVRQNQNTNVVFMKQSTYVLGILCVGMIYVVSENRRPIHSNEF